MARGPSGRSAVLVYLGATWRARWRSLLVLGVMIGLTGGLTTAAAIGARRSASALERFHDAGQTLDVFIAADVINEEPPELLELLDGPLVAKTNDLAFLFVDIDNVGIMFAPTSRRGLDVERGVLLDGRHADPDEPLELVLSETGARQLDLEVGDTLESASYSPEDAEALFTRGEEPEVPGGPTVRFEIVGITRNGFDLNAGGGSNGTALTLTTPAFWEEYEGEIAIGSRSHMVRLVDEPGVVARFTDAVADAYGDEHLPSINVGQGEDAVGDAIAVVTVATIVMALAVGLAGSVWVVTAVARQQRLAGPDVEVLRALGSTSGERRALYLGVVMPALLLGLVITPLLAILLSSAFPVGAARRVDPSSGVYVDGAALALGVLAVGLIVGLAAALTALRLAAGGARAEPSTLRISRLVDATGRALRPAAAAGVRFALHASRRLATPVRPALVGAVVGVIGLVAVAVVGSSLDRLVETPARWGTTWDVALASAVFAPDDVQDENAANHPDRAKIEALRDVEAAAVLLYDDQITVNGAEAIAMSLDPVIGEIRPSIVAGREPQADDEIALGGDTLEDAGVAIGDTVDVASRARERARLRVVGQLAFPTIGEPSPVAVGAALTTRTSDRLRLGDFTISDDAGSRFVVIRWAAGVDHGAALAALGVDDAGTSIDVIAAGPTASPEINGLDDVQGFPLLVGVALAVLGAIAISHALVVTVRRRRLELGVLGALGFEPADRRTAIVVQATTVAAVALIIGVPVGAIVGRVVWSAIAGSIGVSDATVFPFGVLAVGAVALVVALNLIAAWPAHRARRLDVAAALRAE